MSEGIRRGSRRPIPRVTGDDPPAFLCTCGHRRDAHSEYLPAPCWHGVPDELRHPTAITAEILKAYEEHPGCACLGFCPAKAEHGAAAPESYLDPGPALESPSRLLDPHDPAICGWCLAGQQAICPRHGPPEVRAAAQAGKEQAQRAHHAAVLAVEIQRKIDGFPGDGDVLGHVLTVASGMQAVESLRAEPPRDPWLDLPPTPEEVAAFEQADAEKGAPW